MPDTPKNTFDKELARLEKKQQETAERLDKEQAEIRKQTEAARESAQKARERMAELEARRPALALAVVTSTGDRSEGADKEREALEGALSEARRDLELAELAEGEAERRAQELEKRRRRAEHEGRERLYDLYATERRERIGAVEASTGELATRLDELLDLDEGQMALARELGSDPSRQRPYRELVEEFLAHRLGRYVSERAIRLQAFARPVESLLAVDLHTKPADEQRAENEQEGRRVEERDAAARHTMEDYRRREDFRDRRKQLRAYKGYNTELLSGADAFRAEVDVWVNSVLAREGYGDLIEEERATVIEKRRAELRGMLSGGEDYASLSEGRRAEVDRAVEEWLADEYPDGAA